jgi:CheY-like chemotaxis protein
MSSPAPIETILVADDDATARTYLARTLEAWGYEATQCRDGREALERLENPGAPRVAMLDWMMPEMEGPDVCRRASQSAPLTHLILVTAKDRPQDIAAALRAGAHDFLSKPFHPEELQARLRAGVRTANLHAALVDRANKLEIALSQVKQLHGLIPICSYCKRIRDDGDFWERVESYLSRHADVQFTHGICPDCYPVVAAGLNPATAHDQHQR